MLSAADACCLEAPRRNGLIAAVPTLVCLWWTQRRWPLILTALGSVGSLSNEALLNLAQEKRDRRHLLSPAVIDRHLSVLPKSSHRKAICRKCATQKKIGNRRTAPDFRSAADGLETINEAVTHPTESIARSR